MPRDPRAYIFDALKHARECKLIVASTDLDGYLSDSTLQAASRYHLVVVGEALNLLRQLDPTTANRITDIRKIVDLRNFLVHAYQSIDDERLWNTLAQHLDTLIRELSEIEQSSQP